MHRFLCPDAKRIVLAFTIADFITGYAPIAWTRIHPKGAQMSVIVRIPTALRKLAAGNETLNIDGKTVGEVISAIRETYPALADQLVDEKGQVRRFINLFADDEDIRFLEDLDTELRKGAELSIVPAIAGGMKRAAGSLGHAGASAWDFDE
jgi:molybdopterin synthase sulfur carrier subunit